MRLRASSVRLSRAGLNSMVTAWPGLSQRTMLAPERARRSRSSAGPKDWPSANWAAAASQTAGGVPGVPGAAPGPPGEPRPAQPVNATTAVSPAHIGILRVVMACMLRHVSAVPARLSVPGTLLPAVTPCVHKMTGGLWHSWCLSAPTPEPYAQRPSKPSPQPLGESLFVLRPRACPSGAAQPRVLYPLCAERDRLPVHDHRADRTRRALSAFSCTHARPRPPKPPLHRGTTG